MAYRLLYYDLFHVGLLKKSLLNIHLLTTTLSSPKIEGIKEKSELASMCTEAVSILLTA